MHVSILKMHRQLIFTLCEVDSKSDDIAILRVSVQTLKKRVSVPFSMNDELYTKQLKKCLMVVFVAIQEVVARERRLHLTLRLAGSTVAHGMTPAAPPPP